MRETLLVLLPKILSQDVVFEEVDVIAFAGVGDLKRSIGRYCHPDRWRGSDRQYSHFVIICDQDTANCRERKAEFRLLYQNTRNNKPVLIRIACSELESWFLGDIDAVKKGLKIHHLAVGQNKPTDHAQAKERLIAMTFGKYHTLIASSIAKNMNLEKNQSPSFQQLVCGLHKIKAESH